MIESVKARQRGAYDFESHYDNLCAMQDSVPLPAVKANLSSGILDINADRVRSADWPPIINTLSINKSLECVAIRSHFTPPPDTEDKRAQIARKKTPAIRSKEITFRLCKALQSCLSVTPTLMFIELTGVPLRERDINTLMKGIVKNQTLEHLSFEMCRIGDSGLEIVCKGLRGNNKISSLNLTGCCLSPQGAELVAKLIKHQAMKRHTELWRDSLRYGLPQNDKMPGLRRVTLNSNPLLGNQAAQALAEALKDDLWIKALDLHGTGMSTTGAKSFLDVLKYNTSIEVLDLRRNPLIDRSILHTIMEHLMVNCNGKETEYQWIEPAREDEEKTPAKPHKVRRRTTKVLNNSIGKKTTIKVTPSSSRRRSNKGALVVACRQEILESLKPTPGLPWRTAARANRYRGFPPELTPHKPPLEDGSEVDTTSVLITKDESYMNHTADTAKHLHQLEEADRHSVDVQKLQQREMKELKVEVEQLRRLLKEERMERSRADQKVMQLMMENRRLEDDLKITRLRFSTLAGSQRDTSLLQDESIIENIELTFKKFHSFLDMLQEAGLGDLITMAGLNQEQLNVSKALFRSPNKTLPSSSSSAQPSNAPHKGSFKPGVVGSHEPAMGHINDTAYLREKEEADEVYQRLVKQTSGAFTAIVKAQSLAVHQVSPLTQPSGDVLSKVKPTTTSHTADEAFPSHSSASTSDPVTQQEVVREPRSQEDPSPRPVPIPRHRPVTHRKDEGLKDEETEEPPEGPVNRHIPSRASEAAYSMESFEQSYTSERGERVVLGDEGDLQPRGSGLINLDSDDDDF